MANVIALVGRPNVGKSTLFNRLTRSRDALVASYPGLTRDRQYGRCTVQGKSALVVDTGGLSGNEEGIDGPMAEQARAAVAEADVVWFMLDAQSGRTGGDEVIAQMLREAGKTVLPIVNKVDGQNPDFALSEFAGLGLGDPVCISATNGHGVRQLIEEHVPDADQDDDADEYPGIRFAVVGRPNVGKSTLVNRMLGEERVVVFDQAGTTRDSIYIPFERDGHEYTVIDTAGVRRRGRISEKIEKFSVVKTLEAIGDAHIVLLLLDGSEGLVDQDLHLLSHVLDAGRALILLVNKWDGLEHEWRDDVRTQLDRKLGFLVNPYIHFISALHGSGVGDLFGTIARVHASGARELKTAELNQILEVAMTRHPPPLSSGRRIKLRYAHAGGHHPPTIVIHGSQADAVPDSYRRYLEHCFIDALKLEGTPVRLLFRKGDNPFKGRKNKLTERQQNKRKRMIRHVKRNDKKRKRQRS